jgi:hypothetical protein
VGILLNSLIRFRSDANTMHTRSIGRGYIAFSPLQVLLCLNLQF